MARRTSRSAVSSLLRSAQAAYDRSQTYNDQVKAFEFDQSAKSREDFVNYNKYLSDRIDKASDPSKALSLTRTAESARRSFTSSEVRRATIDVLSGNIDNRQKYGQLVGLYNEAISNGDENLAQTIYGQAAQLSVTIQNEEKTAADRAQALGERYANASAGQLKRAADDISKGKDPGSIGYLVDQFRKHGPEALAALKDSQGNPVSYWQAVKSLVEDAATLYEQASNTTSNPETANTYAEKATALRSGDATIGALPGPDGKLQNLNMNQIDQFINAELRSGSAVTPAQDVNGNYFFDARKVSGQYFIRDERTGKLQAVAQYGGAPLSAEQQKQQAAAIKRLQAAGYGVTKDQTSGAYRVTQPNGGSEVTATFDNNGNLVYHSGQDAQGNDQLGRIIASGKDIGKNELISQQEAEAQLKERQLQEGGPTGISFNSKDAIPTLGRKLGILPGAEPGFLQGSNVGSVIQRAETGQAIQKAAALQQQLTNSANTLQPAVPGFNVNQLPVPKNFNLQVAPIGPVPNVSVSPLGPLPSVKVATPSPAPGNIVTNQDPYTRALGIINASTNWGAAAQDLRAAGFNPTDYDTQLKTRYAPPQNLIQKVGSFIGKLF